MNKWLNALLMAPLAGAVFQVQAQDCTSLREDVARALPGLIESLPPRDAQLGADSRFVTGATTFHAAHRSLTTLLGEARTPDIRNKDATLNALLSMHLALGAAGELKATAARPELAGPLPALQNRAQAFESKLRRYADCIAMMLYSLALPP